MLEKAIDRQEEVNNLFNREARIFADSIQKQIDNGRYYRGYLFEAAISKHLSPGAIVLDYGCGVGTISRLISRKGYQVHGVDPSSSNIEISKSINQADSNTKFEVLSDQGESLPNQYYDAIICSSVIEFVADPIALLSHFYRSLKPGGYLFISYANKSSLWRTYAKLRFGKTKEHYKFQSHVWDSKSFISLLKQSGFGKLGRVVYYDSAFEKWRVTNYLNYLFFIGTLGLVSAKKDLQI